MLTSWLTFLFWHLTFLYTLIYLLTFLCMLWAFSWFDNWPFSLQTDLTIDLSLHDDPMINLSLNIDSIIDFFVFYCLLTVSFVSCDLSLLIYLTVNIYGFLQAIVYKVPTKALLVERVKQAQTHLQVFTY